MPTIAIIDYGLGNLRSVAGALEKLGATAVITHETAALGAADKLILPGVGAFGDGMRNLRERGLIEPLRDIVLQRKKPLLGICLGSQLLAHDSDEFGMNDGLGWLDARVRRLAPPEPSFRVPHVGWNEVHQLRACPLFHDIPQDALFYFVHSYAIAAQTPEIVAAESTHGATFVSVLQKDNVYAVQFHPEKSQFHGLTMLRNFIDRA